MKSDVQNLPVFGPQFIVAEISKNYPDYEGACLISQTFEVVINHNLKRGYKLHSFRFTTARDSNLVLETIIAVFELAEVPK